MEQMHPGEMHDVMHKMMGIEEGTEAHKAFHVNIARMMYCGQGMMMQGMMGGRMMRMMFGGERMAMQDMMGGWMMGPVFGFGGVLYTLLLIGLVVLVWLWVVKVWREVFRKR